MKQQLFPMVSFANKEENVHINEDSMSYLTIILTYPHFAPEISAI